MQHRGSGGFADESGDRDPQLTTLVRIAQTLDYH